MSYEITRRASLKMGAATLALFAGAGKAEAQIAGAEAPRAPASSFSVPLALHNMSNASHTAPHVTYAHPFADGDIPRGGSLMATDSNGNPVIVQMDSVSTWPSGCVKWAVLSHACSETFGAGTSKKYTLKGSANPPDNTPDAKAWGGATHANWAATLAANSDIKVIYSGFDAGDNVYTVSLNSILSTYHERNPGWGTNYPTGGWEITKKGPVCIEFHGWQYLKNDKSGLFQGHVRCDMWVKAWSPTGPFEIDVRTVQPNIWNTITPTSEKHNQKQGRFAALVQVKNGSTVIKYDGGSRDSNAVKISNGNFDTTTNRLDYATGAFFPQTAITFSSTGTLPSGLSENTFYWPSYVNGTDRPYLATQRYYCSLIDQNGTRQSWQPNKAYNVNDWIINNNIQYICITAGTSGASGGPTGGSGGSDITDGTVHWTNVTIALGSQGSGDITASPVSMCFPGAGWATADGKGDPMWSGTGSRPAIVPGHDFEYLTQRSKFTMAYQAAAGSTYNGAAQPDYLPARQTGGMQWYQSATGASGNRIGFMNQWQVASLYQPTDPFYYYGVLQGALCWHGSAYASMCDESGGVPLIATSGTYAGLPASIPNWVIANLPGQVSSTIVPRGASWSGWAAGVQNNNGLNGQYYADPSHVPMNSQVAYLKTGRPIFLESAISQASSYHTMVYQGYQTLAGRTYTCLSNGAYGSTQLRGWAWAWRTLFQAFFMTPDDHPFHPVLRDIYNENVSFEAARIKNRYPANQLAAGIPECLDHDNGGAHFAPWMLAFFIQVVALEHWRGGQTAAGKTAVATISNFLANFWARYLPSVNPNAVLYYPAYDQLYAPKSQDWANCYTDWTTMFTASAAAKFFPPPWLTELYDHDSRGNVFVAGFPGNTDSYQVFGQCAVSMHALALPGNSTVTGAKAAIKAALSAASGISQTTGGVQWHGKRGGTTTNVQTHAVF